MKTIKPMKVTKANISRMLGEKHTQSEIHKTRIRGWSSRSAGFMVEVATEHLYPDIGGKIMVSYYQNFIGGTPEYRAEVIQRHGLRYLETLSDRFDAQIITTRSRRVFAADPNTFDTVEVLIVSEKTTGSSDVPAETLS